MSKPSAFVNRNQRTTVLEPPRQQRPRVVLIAAFALSPPVTPRPRLPRRRPRLLDQNTAAYGHLERYHAQAEGNVTTAAATLLTFQNQNRGAGPAELGVEPITKPPRACAMPC